MPICIHCTYPVSHLYTTYSKADDRSLGKGVRLTQCPRCNRFADKYVEHDFVVVFIDLVLVKPQVYRHLLFNHFAVRSSEKEGGSRDGFDPSIIRLGFLLLLFDVYLTWSRVERETPLGASTTSPFLRGPLTSTQGPQTTTTADEEVLGARLVVRQYLFFLALCFLETLAFHLPIRLLLSPPMALVSTVQRFLPSKLLGQNIAWKRYPYPNRVSTALLVSSATPKLFPILMLIWPAVVASNHDEAPAAAPGAMPPPTSSSWGFSAARVVEWAVLGNNVAALQILLDCGWGTAIGLVGAGAVVRDTVTARMLGAVGLWRGGGVLGGLVEFGQSMQETGRSLQEVLRAWT